MNFYLKERTMGRLNAGGMAAIETERAKRAEEIRTLMTTPFDPENLEQLKALKKYTDDFEYIANQMYIYQALSSGVIPYAVSCILSRVLPEFLNPLFTTCLYLGIGGFILERFSMTDFYNQLSEIKLLYNWCLKNGRPNYNEELDNTQKLLNPEIQRMIKLIAPLCSTEFMLVWPKQVERVEENTSYLTGALSFGYSVISAPFSLFSKTPQPSSDQQIRLRELKVSVETRKLDLGAYTGFKQAIDYFMTNITNTDYKALLWSKLDDLKKMAPTPLVAMVSSYKQD